MKLNFENWLPLLLLIPSLFLVIFTFRRYSNKNTKQKILYMMRCLSIICIILSICSINLVKSAKDTTTIFVCDLSESTVNNRKEMEEFISKAISKKSDKDLIGIISFAQNSSTDNAANSHIIFNGFNSKVDSEFTNIQNGLIHGSALFPPNSKRRLVLITDGYENIGDARRQIRSLIQNNISIDVYPLLEKDFQEVQLDKVDIPEKADKNQVIEIVTHIESNVNTTAELLIYSNNQLRKKQQVSIEAGSNKFVFTDKVSSGGLLPYRVDIIPENDTYTENNSLSSFCVVEDEPNILVIQDEDKQGEQLIKILENISKLDVITPEEAPETTETLIKYDAFIIADISIEKLSTKFLDNLKSVIQYQGKGLLVTGGDSSFGPGGYYKTTLEEILPVNVDVTPKKEKPNLGLVLVIDKSGSMSSGNYGITKLELAKEAAIRATEVLEEKDMLGVIAFDDSVKWVVETQKAEDKEALNEQIATIVPGGGTSIRPSLEAAIESLKDQDVALKHIILLTDGQAERRGYEKAIMDLKENKITLSTVAVGDGADRALLKTLANAGNGRYYSTNEFTDIPSIFTKEAFMAGKKYLNNITFTPSLASMHNIMKGINAIPSLDGYVATTKKDNAQVILTSPDNDPILSVWQYGLGRTVAWTSDANGIWTGKWLNWKDSPTFWINLMSWIIQQDVDKKYSIETSYEEGKGVITVNSIGAEENSNTTIEGILIYPDGKEELISLEAVAPGKYIGEFDPSGEGVYLVNLTVNQDSETQKIISGVNVGYSPEYDFFSKSKITPEEIVSISGGNIIEDPSDVYNGYVHPITGSYDLSILLLILGLLTFFIEIVIRKTNIRFTWVEKILDILKNQTHKITVLKNNGNKSKKSNKKSNKKTNINVKEEKENKLNKNDSKKVKKRVNKKDKNEKTDTNYLDILLERKNKRNNS